MKITQQDKKRNISCYFTSYYQELLETPVIYLP